MAIRYDAASDRIAYTGTGIPDPATAFTVMLWAQLATDRGDFSTFCRLSNNIGQTVATIATGSNGTTPSYFTGGGSIVSSLDMTVGTWYHIAATCAGTSGALYVAAYGGSTTTNTGTVSGFATPNQICFGGRSAGDSSEQLDGAEEWALLYSANLTQAEVEAQRYRSIPVRGANLEAMWPISSPADLTDRTPNTLNLSAGSTATAFQYGPALGEFPWGLVGA